MMGGGMMAGTMAGSPLMGTGLVADVVLGIQIIVGGIDRTGICNPYSVNVSTELESRAEASFQVFDSDALLHFSFGEQVYIRRSGITIFAGTVASVDENVPDGASELFAEVECVDFNALADRHLVATKFSNSPQNVFSVVSAVLGSDTDNDGLGESVAGDIEGETLWDEGVRILGTVEAGPDLGVVVANHIQVSELYDDIAELAGMFWFIDFDKVLHFRTAQNFRAPFDLDDAVWRRHRNLRASRDGDQYRNLQLLRAGRDITDPRVETMKGDGETRSFTLALPVAEAPTIRTNIGAGFVSRTVGIKEKDEGKDWYFAIDSDTVTQDTDATVLGATHVLEVTYKGFYPILVQARLEDEIKNRKAIEGGTGLYAHVETDERVNDLDLAEEKAAALLRRYGKVPNMVEFETDELGFQVGQLLRVNLPSHHLSGDWLITKVDFGVTSYGRGNPETYAFRVQATDGEFLGGWADFFKRLFSKTGRPSLRENDTLSLLREFFDEFQVTDTLSTTDALGNFKIDRSFLLVGGPWVGGLGQVSVSDSSPGMAWGPAVGTPLHLTVS